MFDLDYPELIVILVILLIVFGGKNISGLWGSFKNGGGPFIGPKSGLDFQLADSSGSALSPCPKCGAPTKGFYENCPVCGEKIGERLAVAKTL